MCSANGDVSAFLNTLLPFIPKGILLVYLSLAFLFLWGAGRRQTEKLGVLLSLENAAHELQPDLHRTLPSSQECGIQGRENNHSPFLLPAN